MVFLFVNTGKSCQETLRSSLACMGTAVKSISAATDETSGLGLICHTIAKIVDQFTFVMVAATSNFRMVTGSSMEATSARFPGSNMAFTSMRIWAMVGFGGLR